MQRIILSVLLVVFLASPASAQTTAESLLAIYDLDRDKTLGPDEQDQLARDQAIIASRGPASAVPPKGSPPEPTNNEVKSGLLVRDAYAANAFLTAGEKIPDGGAQFNFTQDFNSSDWILSGSGAVMYGIIAETNILASGDPNRFRISHVAFIPGFEFDGKRSSGGTAEGSLSGKVGVEFETLQGGLFPVQYWKFDALYTTDMEGEASIYGATAMWQPLAYSLPIGKTFQVSRRFDLWATFIPTLDLDYAHVGSNGMFTALEEGADYLWAGTKVNSGLFFDSGPLQRFSAYAKYMYLYNLLDKGEDSIHYLQVGAKYDLVPDMVALESRYTLGNTPRTLEDKDDLYVGLAVKLGSLRAE